MKDRKLLNGFYNYTVVLTYIGMLLGLFGISRAIEGDFRGTVIFLMFAGLCDMFDGAIASTRERTDSEKRFGIQIDSLSDLICFGVLPAVYVYAASGKSVAALICGGFYALCGLIRLAYYNVCEEERQLEEDCARKYFSGLPITAGAVIYPLAFIVGAVSSVDERIMLPIVAGLTGLAFVLTFKLRKPKTFGKAVLVILAVSALVVIIGGFFGIKQ